MFTFHLLILLCIYGPKDNVSKGTEELPWQSNGYNSALAMQGLQVQFLVGELRRVHVLFRIVKKKKKRTENKEGNIYLTLQV